MAKLRKLFKDSEILDALADTDSDGDAGKKLSKLGRGKISKQLMRYWRRQLTEITKKDGTPYEGSGRIDKKIQLEEVKLRTPSQSDDDRTTVITYDNSRILNIPDQHAPYQHPDALDFLMAVRKVIEPTRIVNLGDETDGHGLSMHDSDPNLDSAGVELVRAREWLHALEQEFPIMDICHSNHGSLIYRRAFKFGIPAQYIKSYREIIFPDGSGQGWDWKGRHRATLPNGEEVIFQHQSAGDTLVNAGHERASIVEGHEHGKFEIQYRKSTNALYWTIISGCLIDPDALAFAYGRLFPKRPILGCSVIIDSIPRLIPMVLDRRGRWIRTLSGF
jgi:hypothetical protein